MKNLDKYIEVFNLFLDKEPPKKMIEEYFTTDSIELQDFVLNNLKGSITWSTGIGVIEAVQHIVLEAEYNCNI